jgi:hypothetical protein
MVDWRGSEALSRGGLCYGAFVFVAVPRVHLHHGDRTGKFFPHLNTCDWNWILLLHSNIPQIWLLLHCPRPTNSERSASQLRLHLAVVVSLLRTAAPLVSDSTG